MCYKMKENNFSYGTANSTLCKHRCTDAICVPDTLTQYKFHIRILKN